MDPVRKTVGVYDRPEKRVGLRAALIAGGIAAAALAAAAVMFL